MGKNLVPLFGIRCDEKTMEKMGHIAKQNTRSRNEEIVHALKEYIKNYEKTHGEIATDKSLRGGGRRVRRVKKITFYSISLANFAAPRPRATYVGAPAFPLWLAWGQVPLSMEQAEGDYSS